MSEQREFTIFGAGLSGALMAVYLARAGHRVRLYERRPDPRTVSLERGRSINLALSTRGIDALQRVGLAEEVLATAIRMPGRMIHPRSGPLAFQKYSADPANAINSVSRNGLNITLLNAAEREPNVRIIFGKRCLGVDFEKRIADVQDEATGAVEQVAFQHAIGADGAFSGVRGSMQKRDRFDYSQSYLSHGYKELTIPAAEGGGFRIEKHALHIWPRGTYMMIALPNQDGSFTCTLFWPFEGPNSFEALRSAEDIRNFFKDQFPDAVPLIPDLVDDFQNNPTASLVTVRCGPWHVGDAAVLIGDAAHAVVPFYGQGMNASFEDCAALDDCLKRHPKNVGLAFEEYSQLRKPHTDALAQLAVDNFYEMRDKAGRASFRAKKKFEHALERWLPGWYLSLYEMVSFSTIPYAQAVARAKQQREIVAAVPLLLAMLTTVLTLIIAF
jgi:kynurenine 3-monooxygenase